jgi:hypothetical protein
MDLSSNDLTGTIPSELGRCISLLLLDVSGNHLVGTVPTELAMLPLFGKSPTAALVSIMILSLFSDGDCLYPCRV